MEAVGREVTVEELLSHASWVHRVAQRLRDHMKAERIAPEF
jgi:hypothetical protein